ncbi:MAG TPA: hypothetical protein VIK41_10355, partial [Gemmatimonadaceae bacterium]
MLTMRVAAWACLAIAMVTAPCRSQGKATPERRATVEAWVTTADKAKLLARTPNVPLASGEQQGIATTIEVDTAITYQEMVGFGAAITDASAWLIQTKLSPKCVREKSEAPMVRRVKLSPMPLARPNSSCSSASRWLGE